MKRIGLFFAVALFFVLGATVASAQTPPPVPTCTGTIVVQANKADATYNVYRSDGMGFGWSGSHVFTNAPAGEYRVYAEPQRGYRTIVDPSSTVVLQCGATITFTVTFVAARVTLIGEVHSPYNGTIFASETLERLNTQTGAFEFAGSTSGFGQYFFSSMSPLTPPTPSVSTPPVVDIADGTYRVVFYADGFFTNWEEVVVRGSGVYSVGRGGVIRLDVTGASMTDLQCQVRGTQVGCSFTVNSDLPVLVDGELQAPMTRNFGGRRTIFPQELLKAGKNQLERFYQLPADTPRGEYQCVSITVRDAQDPATIRYQNSICALYPR